MPVHMIRFERLAYCSLAIDLLVIVLENSTSAGLMLGIPALTSLVIVVAIIGAALISATAHLRKNWLRWLYSVLMVVGVTFDVWTVATTFPATSVLAQVLSVGSDVLDVICVCLLFAASSNVWFHKPAAVTPRQEPATA